MHPAFQQIIDELKLAEAALISVVPASPALNHITGGFGVAGVSLSDLLRRLSSTQQRLLDANPEEPGNDAGDLAQILSGLQFMRAHSIPQLNSANASTALPAFFITMDGLDRLLTPFIDIDSELALENGKAVRRIATQARGLESKLRELSPRTSSVEGMIERIESAYEAADQLPSDLETLSEARLRIASLSQDAEKDRAKILATKTEVDAAHASLGEITAEAKSILKQCESALSSATSVGLAAAFSERSRNLDWSMWFWVAGLIGSLYVGGSIGSSQLRMLLNLLADPSSSSAAISLNTVLILISVGAPIWFAWLATKQVGQRFRLSEDYAFKASISRAYEGYSKEAASVDPELKARLLESALSRFDEQPLRLVESASYGSPWHELLASDLVKDAAKSVPGFVDRVTKLAGESLDKIKPKRANPIAANSTINPVAEEAEKLPV